MLCTLKSHLNEASHVWMFFFTFITARTVTLIVSRQVVQLKMFAFLSRHFWFWCLVWSKSIISLPQDDIFAEGMQALVQLKWFLWFSEQQDIYHQKIFWPHPFLPSFLLIGILLCLRTAYSLLRKSQLPGKICQMQFTFSLLLWKSRQINGALTQT